MKHSNVHFIGVAAKQQSKVIWDVFPIPDAGQTSGTNSVCWMNQTWSIYVYCVYYLLSSWVIQSLRFMRMILWDSQIMHATCSADQVACEITGKKAKGHQAERTSASAAAQRRSCKSSLVDVGPFNELLLILLRFRCPLWKEVVHCWTRPWIYCFLAAVRMSFGVLETTVDLQNKSWDMCFGSWMNAVWSSLFGPWCHQSSYCMIQEHARAFANPKWNFHGGVRRCEVNTSHLTISETFIWCLDPS